MKRTFDIAPWHVATHKWDPQDKRLQESMTSLANENLGMRGFFEEGYSGDHMEGIYLGGVWFPDKTRVGWWKNGYPKYFGKMINAVNFMKLIIKVNGEQLDLAKQTPKDFKLDLDMKRGVLERRFTVEIGGTEMYFNFERFVSVTQKELVGQRLHIKNRGDSDAKVEITSMIDADVYNEDANYDEQFWNVLGKSADGEHAELTSMTKKNDFGTPQFIVGMKTTSKTNLDHVGDGTDEKHAYNTFAGTVAAGKEVNFEKRSIVMTSRDYDSQADIEKNLDVLGDQLDNQSFDDLLDPHIKEWADRWVKSDVEIEGDEGAQQGIRFNLFQLFSTYYGQDYRLNISPKGFTGEKYGGATYWDTEAYCIPVYLGVADPEVARNLLMYRYKQLDGAFVNAKEQGLDGALFPMVTFNGIECHNEWEITFEEIHRNADIPHAIAMYTDYTGDDSYVKNEGMDVLVGTARFWAARVHWSKMRNKYVMHGVTGPNEYENNVNNNWFTNTMARWLLKYTLERLPLATKEAQERVRVTDEEKAKWQDIVDNMYLPEDEDLGIFLQQDDFLDKDIRPVTEIEDQRPINQHWSWDKILRSPFIKQADVLQGIYFFDDQYTMDQKEKNFDFYEPLTVHESSLSPCIYSIMAAELGKKEKAVELYQRTARLDLDNYNNDTVDGLHITSMSGSWLAIVQGFAGMRYDHDQLKFNPFVPDGWDHYSFKINYRGRLIEVYVDHDECKITLLSGDDLEVMVHDNKLDLKEGKTECLKA